MPKTKYLQFKVGDETIDVEQIDQVPVAISYALEDPENFENKKASLAFDVSVPCTGKNDRVFNTFHNPNVEDMTTGQIYRKSQPCAIIAGGIEVLAGKAFLNSGSHTNKPGKYSVNCFGNNGDWMIELKETTLLECLSTATHVFTKANIEASWGYNGTNIAQDFVYAPVRYTRPFDGGDTIVRVIQMRPALFLYWILYRGFKKAGYKLVSSFMDTTYFRRLVLPWTWGDFLRINSKISDLLKFKTTGAHNGFSYFHINTNGSGSGNGNGWVYPGAAGGTIVSNTWEMGNDFAGEGFDNNDSFTFHNGGPYSGAMEWTYQPALAAQLGNIKANFTLKVLGKTFASYGSYARVYAAVYKSGALVSNNLLYDATAGIFDSNDTDGDNVTARILNFQIDNLTSGDNVVVRLHYTTFKSLGGFSTIEIFGTNPIGGGQYVYSSLELTSIQIIPGSTVNWAHYDKFSAIKFLDLFRGVVDLFNLSVQTDSRSKTIAIEPTYPYSLNSGSGLNPGYFKDEPLLWENKRDLSKESFVNNFNDAEREMIFQFKADGSDGGVNKYALRNSFLPGTSKYVFSDRMKEGKKEYNNRFFSPVMHYEAKQWQNITGVTPQLLAITSENISNSSKDDAENAFEPKIAYYKGLVDRNVYGGWNWDGDTGQNLPFMFAVNYKTGGEDDPVLTYCDQKINGELIAGLMKRFFLQRLAIMRYGKLYETWFNLNNNDITNWFHREPIIANKGKYYIVAIDNYRPLIDSSTKVRMWKFHPITETDVDSCYPSENAVINQPLTVDPIDIKYQPSILIKTDIPK